MTLSDLYEIVRPADAPSAADCVERQRARAEALMLKTNWHLGLPSHRNTAEACFEAGDWAGVIEASEQCDEFADEMRECP